MTTTYDIHRYNSQPEIAELWKFVSDLSDLDLNTLRTAVSAQILLRQANREIEANRERN